jgi:hypothetical protein
MSLLDSAILWYLAVPVTLAAVYFIVKHRK